MNKVKETLYENIVDHAEELFSDGDPTLPQASLIAVLKVAVDLRRVPASTPVEDGCGAMAAPKAGKESK